MKDTDVFLWYPDSVFKEGVCAHGCKCMHEEHKRRLREWLPRDAGLHWVKLMLSHMVTSKLDGLTPASFPVSWAFGELI